MKLGKERADTPRESRETKRIRMARRGWRAGGALMEGGSADGAAPPEDGLQTPGRRRVSRCGSGVCAGVERRSGNRGGRVIHRDTGFIQNRGRIRCGMTCAAVLPKAHSARAGEEGDGGSETVGGLPRCHPFRRDYLHIIVSINSSGICTLLFEPILKCELESVKRGNVRSSEMVYLCTDLSD